MKYLSRKPIRSLIAMAIATVFSCTVQAAENLTAETAAPGGSIHLSMAHLAEVAAEAGVANIQVADGQTLTNSIQNVAIAIAIKDRMGFLDKYFN